MTYSYDRRIAMEHPSEDARKKYFQEHPKADPRKHTVSEGRGGGDDSKSADPTGKLTRGLNLPRDLKKMTRKQQKDAVTQLAKKPLLELRRMQDIVKKQIPKAFEQRNDLALGNLQTMENLLTGAVDKREFGD